MVVAVAGCGCEGDVFFCEEWDEEGGCPAGAEDEDVDGRGG